jgi:hypothetical protein
MMDWLGASPASPAKVSNGQKRSESFCPLGTLRESPLACSLMIIN